MEWVAGVVVALVVLAGLGAWRRRRRAALMDRLTAVMRELGLVVARQGGQSSLETIEQGRIVLSLDGKRLELDLVRALEIQEEPDPALRQHRLRWLVEQARIQQGV